MNRLALQADILESNHKAAAANRRLFAEAGTLVINLMSAPGAGKTSLLEATIRALNGRYRLGVLEGDLQTDLDAERIRAVGTPSFQITTGTVCHLDARMIAKSLGEFPVHGFELLFIENVGNLICPASYDLGENLRAVLCSVTEGVEKPKKYPVMFHKADVVILNKSDLVSSEKTELKELENNVREVNPKATVFPVSCKTGDGLEMWLEWLRQAIIVRGILIDRS